MADLIEGHIHLAFVAEYLPRPLVLGLLPTFRRQYPQIRFSLTYESRATIEEGLIAERIGFGIVDQLVENDFIDSVDLGTLDYVAVATKSYVKERGPFERKESILLGDLIDLGASLPLLASWLGTVDAATVAMLQQVRPAFIVPDVHAAHELMANDMGIAFLPRSLVARDLAAGRFVHLAPSQTMPSRPVQLLYRRRKTRQLVESLFIEHMLEAKTTR